MCVYIYIHMCVYIYIYTYTYALYHSYVRIHIYGSCDVPHMMKQLTTYYK